MTAMLTRQQITATALIGSGLARFSRQKRIGEACILTFHGLRGASEHSDLLDPTLHTPKDLFHELCAHLAAHYRVLPLSQITNLLLRGEALPERVVALTFDDGYESNHRLAFPILREFGLPATIFLCTGLTDGTVRPWFHRLELALARATTRELDVRVGEVRLRFSTGSMAERAAALPLLLRAFKSLPQAAVEGALDALITALEPAGSGTPVQLRAMSWHQVRELRGSGLIEFGAHTHSHPILGRCTPEVARHEIITSRDRITAELGEAPSLFAYPNGYQEDFNSETTRLLQAAGFRAAFTMKPGPVHSRSSRYDLSRYGSPESLHQAEATVSGAFETFKEWRRKLRSAFALWM
jgi:peptidoglycan/xylan/chitin deacetylase (PgdA/CDA1 family)